jgi:hypothetical protein
MPPKADTGARRMTSPKIFEPGMGTGKTTLGVLGAGHLGDVLCVSPLPRLLSERLGRRVWVTDTANARAVFGNNPYVEGLASAATLPVNHLLRGSGHVIQRFQQGLSLPVQPRPMPELYLDDAEREWASDLRRRAADGRRVCVLSTGALTDGGNAGRIDWGSIARVLGKDYAVIQPIVDERNVVGTVACRGLSVRQYMALVWAADLFVGATSGGSHVAAAFDVPSLIVAWRSLLDPLRFPTSGPNLVAAFLYPQHWFIASEDVAANRFNEPMLRSVLTDLHRHGRFGRPFPAGLYPAGPAGFVPKVIQFPATVKGRLMRLPAVRV